MVRDLSIPEKEEIKTELKNEFSNLTDAELDAINISVERLIDSISAKTNKVRSEVERIVEEKVEYIGAKNI